MDGSRRLLVVVLLLVLVKTIQPALPIYLRYHLYLGWYYASRLQRWAGNAMPTVQRALKRAPIKILQALVAHLSPSHSRKRRKTIFKQFQMALQKKDPDEDASDVRSLLMELACAVRRETALRAPLALHTLSDNLTYLYHSGLRPLYLHYQRLPYHDYILTAACTAVLLLAVKRVTRRVRNATEVPLEWYKQRKKLRGWCVAVTDSDNIRLYHTPTPLHRPAVDNRASRKLDTINVRLAGVDAPEMGHFGGDAQPFAKEAKEWLTKTILNKQVLVTLHRLDQYNRVIGSVKYWPDGVLGRVLSCAAYPLQWAPYSLSLEMVRAGYAVVYENAGAEYDGLKDVLVEAEKRARKERIGMWQQPEQAFVHPSDYKKLRLLNTVLNASSGFGKKSPIKAG